ncbi:hypothetical protein FRC09_012088 [Ceratobasidium sp. 395]|nr:hypothetical protein FRC09_012088 [Ceratobasidium sp. 395]
MSNNLLHPDTTNLPYYVATYKGRSVAIKRDPDYQNTIKLVQKSIPKLRSVDGRDVFLSAALENYGGALVQISEEIWPDIVDQVKVVEVVLEGDDEPADSAGVGASRVAWAPRDGSTSASILPAYQAQDVLTEDTLRPDGSSPVDRLDGSSSGFPITICTTSQKILKLDGFCSSSRVEQIMSLLEAEYGVPAILQRLELRGKRLERTKTLEQSGITKWTTVDLFLNARQCMIFIYPDPQSINTNARCAHENIEVQYSINRAWELSTLFPSGGEPYGDYIQEATWNVDVRANRTLFDRGAQTEITSIFWDGISKSHQPTAPDLSLSQSRLVESPLITTPLLDPSNSVVVPVNEVNEYISYLSHYLRFNFGMLSNTSFMAQVEENGHPYFALRILSQAGCKTMASLATTPEARDILSVVVLYKGLSKSAARAWDVSFPQYGGIASANFWIESLQPAGQWSSWPGFKVFEFAWMEVC